MSKLKVFAVRDPVPHKFVDTDCGLFQVFPDGQIYQWNDDAADFVVYDRRPFTEDFSDEVFEAAYPQNPDGPWGTR
jgi:hypothetical protein